ncbi:MAG: hypothetical protein K8S87_10795 [Planctomycetes bacterium]|nr:hypothetical protein [Planctomycetota bacterium]
MKYIFTSIAILGFISLSFGQHDEQFIEKHSNIHKVVVTEILQTSSHTYLLVQDGNKLQWLAVPKIKAEVGEIYYYQGGNEMKDFKSSQLNRTFESVLFLGGIVNADPLADEKSSSPTASGKTNKNANSIEIAIEPLENGITISELFSNKLRYEDKIVRIKGQVTQFSASIMGKNWIHLQDGTDYLEDFDLVVTSNMDVEVGDIVVIKGKISLDKDFGHGYFYKVIMEDGKIIP